MAVINECKVMNKLVKPNHTVVACECSGTKDLMFSNLELQGSTVESVDYTDKDGQYKTEILLRLLDDRTVKIIMLQQD